MISQSLKLRRVYVYIYYATSVDLEVRRYEHTQVVFPADVSEDGFTLCQLQVSINVVWKLKVCNKTIVVLSAHGIYIDDIKYTSQWSV